MDYQMKIKSKIISIFSYINSQNDELLGLQT